MEHKTPVNKALSQDFVTVGQAARMLGRSADTVVRYCKAGRLTYVQAGCNGPRLIAKASVERLAAELPKRAV
ncbi:helix-turn-helix domain-containing protein [Meiothermus taiwanensis]|uniref:Helix-turn-helix domain-containing protein n=1 Tax=Meiothermus taiwanensis WR-220 TaxID=1339250 RepID=A0ABM6WJA3_9DEIN|nr:hypothetical protein Mtai_v1c18230 [Meiothermus taiwanensis WR-220]